MKRTMMWLATALLGLGLIGCAKTDSPDQAVTGNYAPAESSSERPTSASSVAEPSADDRASREQTASNSQEAKKESASKHALRGGLNKVSSSAERNRTKSTRTATRETETHATSAPVRDDHEEDSVKTSRPAKSAHDALLDGIDHPQVLADFADVQASAQKNPTDVIDQLNYSGILYVIGQLHTKGEQQEKADEAYTRSAAVLDKLLKSGEELPEGIEPLLAAVYYNRATVHGRKEETKEAATAIEKAVQFGFDEFDKIESDESFADLRSSSDFAAKLETWQQAAAEEARKSAQLELAEGESFPFDFSLTTVDGQPIRLADYLGKVVIVDIWGTWCGPCVKEIPSFVKLQETYGAEGFQMIGLNEEHGETPEESAEVVRTFMAEHDMNYPCALIDEATKEQVPDFQGYPTTLFIDRTGKVRLKLVGLHPYVKLEAIVTTLLAEPAPEGTPEEPESGSVTEEPATDRPSTDVEAEGTGTSAAG